MPPKKKGKKPKKTKEELEAEKKVKEEEEERIRQEELKKLEVERKKKEEEECLRQEQIAECLRKEKEFLEEEERSNRSEIQERQKLLECSLSEKLEISRWEKYLACEKQPDVQYESEINSFVNSWGVEEEKSLEQVIVSCNFANQVMEDLSIHALECQSSSDEVKKELCSSFVHDLREKMKEKLDLVTERILQYSDEFLDDPQKNEVKLGQRENWIKYGLWINLHNKGFRNKSLEFSNIDVVIDIPKSIASHILALRVTFLPYDHATSLPLLPKINPLEFSSSSTSLLLPQKKSSSSSSSTSLLLPQKTDGPLDGCSTDCGISDPLQSEATVNESNDIPCSSFSQETISDPSDVIPSSTPGSVTPGAPTPDSSTPDSSTPAFQPFSRYVALGGILCIHLLGLPPAPKQVKGWTLREVNQQMTQLLKYLPYPLEGNGATTNYQPVKVKSTLPESVIVPKVLRLGWWDEVEKQWNEDGFSEVKYCEDTRTIQYNTLHLGSIGLLQERDAYFGITSWFLEVQQEAPEPMATLTLEIGSMTIVIEVYSETCKLIRPNLSELNEIKQQNHTPGKLIHLLAKAGINIAPTLEEALYFNRNHIKNQLVEQKMLTEIVTIASTFDIRYQKDMTSEDTNTLCVLVRESDIFQPPSFRELRDEYKVIQFSYEPQIPGKCKCYVMPNDQNTTNSNLPLWNHDQNTTNSNLPLWNHSHLYLKECVKTFCTPDAVHRLSNSSVVFENTLFQLMKLLFPTKQ